MTQNSSGVKCKIADPCRLCEFGYPHRAVLTVYDPASGEYVPKDDRPCVARWERRGNGHAGDDICGASGTERVAGVDLCDYHFERLSVWGCWEMPARENKRVRAELRESAKDLRREVAEDEERRARLAEEERERIRARYSIVYFVRRVSDEAIKIGTTRGYEQRMTSLRAAHGELQLLLTLAGDRDLELAMHKKFDLYRKPRTEWFAPTRVLLEWVYDQRSDRRDRNSQLDDVLGVSELRKLVRAAPYEQSLRWRAGRVMWPQPAAADPAA